MPPGGELSRFSEPGKARSLLIQSPGPVSSSWRTTVLLEPGRYRFQGRLRVEGVERRKFSARNGAGLRVVGEDGGSSPLFTQVSDWQSTFVDFEVQQSRRVELACELAAARGKAWFELPSLELVWRQ